MCLSSKSLILKIKDIVLFAATFPIFPSELSVSAKSVLHMRYPQITEIGTGKIGSWASKKTEKTENLISNLSEDPA